MRYEISRCALADLGEIHQHIALDSPAAAERMTARFFKTFELLAGQPELGAVYDVTVSTDLRHFSVGAYVLFYRIRDSDLQVARVLHGARDLNRQIGDA